MIIARNGNMNIRATTIEILVLLFSIDCILCKGQKRQRAWYWKFPVPGPKILKRGPKKQYTYSSRSPVAIRTTVRVGFVQQCLNEIGLGHLLYLEKLRPRELVKLEAIIDLKHDLHTKVSSYTFVRGILETLKNNYISKCIPTYWTLTSRDDFKRAYQKFFMPKDETPKNIALMANVIKGILRKHGVTKDEFIEVQSDVYHRASKYILGFYEHCMDNLRTDECELLINLTPNVDPLYKTIFLEIHQKLKETAKKG